MKNMNKIVAIALLIMGLQTESSFVSRMRQTASRLFNQARTQARTQAKQIADKSLFWGITNNSPFVVDQSLSFGANPNARNKNGDTAVIEWVRHPRNRTKRNKQAELSAELLADRKKIFDSLVRAGANLDEHGKYNSAMNWAAILNDTYAIEALILGGADVNKVAKVLNNTPLFCAIAYKSEEAAEMLKIYGGKMYIRDEEAYKIFQKCLKAGTLCIK